MKQPLFKLVVPVLALPRQAKRVVALSVDFSLCVLTVWLAYYLRLDEFVPLSGNAFWAVGVSVGIAIPIFVVSGLYRAIFRYTGWPALLAVARAVGIYGLLYASIFTAIGIAGVPRTIGIIQPILLLLFVGTSRALARVWLGDQYLSILKKASRPKVLIYGSGKTGRQLAAAVASSHEIQIAGFLDDDASLHGRMLNGQPVFNPADLDRLIERFEISQVFLAMPRLSRQRRNEILNRFRGTHVAVRTLPRVTDLAQGRVRLSDLGELDIDDLLGREPVAANLKLLAENVAGKVILVTGAGGSIGSELCRQILLQNPKTLVLFELSEFALYAIERELMQLSTTVTIVPVLGSVLDFNKLARVIRRFGVQTVYHAAAYKHVPMIEMNPAAGVWNNVFGTLRTVESACKAGVETFVLVSTDKAVRPTNVMGCSKRMAELVLQAKSLQENRLGVHKTKLTMVRFGNVLGSSGSVVPVFREQIKNGGPVTVTHPEIIRYFMTIPEAAQLVIQAGALGEGGDVMVLDMGEPVKIVDLAKRVIHLSGFSHKDETNPNGDIDIQFSGLRPGEKLYEELLIGDNTLPTSDSRIMRAVEHALSWEALEPLLFELEAAIKADNSDAVRDLLKKVVPEFKPQSDNRDILKEW